MLNDSSITSVRAWRWNLSETKKEIWICTRGSVAMNSDKLKGLLVKKLSIFCERTGKRQNPFNN